MTFLGAIRSVFTKYATFTGRSSRSEFWWWILFEWVTRSLLGFIYSMTMLAILVPKAEALKDQSALLQAMWGAIFNPMYFVLLAWSLALLRPSLAVTVRRFHDIGRSGWFVLLTFIPVVGTILMILFLVEESDSGANAWGEPPTKSAPATIAPATASATTKITPTKSATTKSTPAKSATTQSATAKKAPAKKPATKASTGGAVAPKK